MPNPDPALTLPRDAAVASSPSAVVARDTGQTLAALPRADAARHPQQLERDGHAGAVLARLTEITDHRRITSKQYPDRR